jgi:hypothetical protein
MDNYNFIGSFSVKVCSKRVAFELSPAEEHGGTAGMVRVRKGRRWVDCPDGMPRFFDRTTLAELVAQEALGEFRRPPQRPKMRAKQRVSVSTGDDSFSLCGWTVTAPILAYDGQWKIAVSTVDGTEFYDCVDVTVR